MVENRWNREQPQPESFEETREKLHRYCLFLTKDQWDGEDLAQEAILKAVNKYGKEGDFTPALLKKIAYHLWIDHVRKYEKEFVGYPASIEKEAESQKEADEELVEKLLSHLTPKQLISFVLKEAFQYKISEIADHLHMSEPAVKALLNRARTRLKVLAHVEKPEILWTAEDHERVSQILMNALTEQDPAILIQSIPVLIPSSQRTRQPYCASPVLSMAA